MSSKVTTVSIFSKSSLIGFAYQNEQTIFFGSLTSANQLTCLPLHKSVTVLTSKKSSLDLALNQGIKTKFVIEAKASFTVLYPTIVTSLAHCHSSVLKLNVTAAEIMSKLNDASSLALLVLLNYIDDKTTITAIEHKAVRGLMLVSKTSKADLRIRHAEIHPSLINSKKLIEGLSVKALLGKPFTAQGKHYLDFLLDNPSSDPKEIKKRLDFIEALLSCDKSRLLAFRTFSRQVKEFAKMKIALDSFSKSLVHIV